MATTPQETLADEARRRIPAAAAGIGAGVLSLLASLLALSTTKDIPSVTVVGALREHLNPGAPPKIGLKAREVLYYDHHALALVSAKVVLALSFVAIGITLSFLYRAAYARRPEIGRATVIVVITATVLASVPAIISAVALVLGAHSFAGAADQGAHAARDVLGSPVAYAGVFLSQLGGLLVGLAFVLVSLKAMSVGLLSRFLGVLGIIVGVISILPFGSALPFVQIFWLIAIGLLFLGRAIGSQGMPPAWVTGEAVPWPSQQELREARQERQTERSSAGGGGGGGFEPPSFFGRRGGAATREQAPPAPASTNGKGRGRPVLPETPAPSAPQRPAHPSSKKKKRKRR